MLIKTIKLKKLHLKQRFVYDNRKRFNVVSCGRRWGKTELAMYLIVMGSIQNKFNIAYYAPTYKMLNEVWKLVNEILNIILKNSNSTIKQVELVNGSVIDFWSLKNIDSSRGRKYHRVIVDEAAMIKKLEEAWLEVIRPTLTDFRGDAYFLSTPKSFYNYFHNLFKNAETKSNWASFQMPTSSNPYISKKELEEVSLDIPKKVYLQEYEAEFVNFEGNTFIEFFDKDKNISNNLIYNKNEVLYLSFDFNITNTCIVVQNYENKIMVLKEYHIKGFDLEDVCELVKVDFPNALIIVTGDASGNSGSALTKGNVSAYQMIKGFLNLGNAQIKAPKSNPSHLNSKLQCNILFKKYDIKIDSSCNLLIKDIEMVTTDKNGNIDKKDSNLTHLLDSLRYYLWTFHYTTFKNIVG